MQARNSRIPVQDRQVSRFDGHSVSDHQNAIFHAPTLLFQEHQNAPSYLIRRRGVQLPCQPLPDKGSDDLRAADPSSTRASSTAITYSHLSPATWSGTKSGGSPESR